MRVISAPINVFLVITELCNLSCRHCATSSPRFSQDNLKLNEWLRLLRRLVELKVFELVISGGEPLCYKGLFPLLEYIEGTHLHYTLNTNATLITRETAKRLGDLQRLDGILIGLDGSTASVHDALRGEGVFQRTLRGIELLKEFSESGINLFCVVTKLNYKDLPSIAQVAGGLNVDSIQFEPLLVQGNAIHYQQELLLSLDETRKVYQTIEELSLEYGDFISGNYLTMGGYYRDFKKWAVELKDLPEAAYMNACNAGIEKCALRPDGWVIPCDRLYDLKVGNIRKRDIQDIWLNSERFQKFRQRFSHRISELRECRDCPYNRFCQGGCPAVPYYLNRKLVARDPTSCYRILSGEEVAHGVLK